MTAPRPRSAAPDIPAPASPYRDILHATDLSLDGEDAFRAALAIALAGRGSLSIVHSEPHRDRAGRQWAGFPRVRQTLAGWGLLAADAPASAVRDTLGLRVEKVDAGGSDPALGVGRILAEQPCDLVVMATHGERGPAGWPRGSQAQAVAAATHAPSLFIPVAQPGLVDPASGRASLRHVLVPLDAWPRADTALAAAAGLAAQLGCPDAVFHLLHVGADWPVVTLPPSLTQGQTGGSAGRVRQIRANGPVAPAILETADEIAADLIVMATVGRHGIFDALRGSVTEQVVRASRRPVLAVPAR